MGEKLSDALGEALALVEKATPETWVATVGGGVKQDHGVHVFQPNRARGERTHDNAAATAAAINLLRQHGPAIAAVLRAVEGAQTAVITREDWLEDIEQISPSLIGQRVALVPLDAAGSAEGRAE